MLHSSTKPLLLGGLGAWRCLSTDWELCGYAENKESGNISCMKMQHPGLDDLSLAAGAKTSCLPCMAALKHPHMHRLHIRTPNLCPTYAFPPSGPLCTLPKITPRPLQNIRRPKQEMWSSETVDCHSNCWIPGFSPFHNPPFPTGTRSSCQDWHIHPPY